MGEVTGLLVGGRVRTPEEALVFAILAQAVSDLFGGESANERLHRRDAMAFLTAKNGPWALRRREECDYVGIDPDVLRSRIIAILEGKAEINHLPERSRKSIVEARAMWAEVKPKPAPAPERVKRYNCEDLYRLLPDGEFSVSDIARRTPVEEKYLPKLLNTLAARGLIERAGGGLFRKMEFTTPIDPMHLPRIIPKTDPMKVAKDLVYGLLNEPRTWTEIQKSLNGRLTENRIRTVLETGVESGELIRGEKRRYRLHDASPALPQSLVAANSG
jgi:hypothetical protein